MLPAIVVGAAVVFVGAWLLSRARRGTTAEASGGGRGVLSAGDAGGGRAIDAEPSPEIKFIIETVARAHSIPVAFAMANAAMESRFRARAGLNTLGGAVDPDGDGSLTASAERSIGLMQINVNPGRPVGVERLRLIGRLMGKPDATDGERVEWLKDPTNNVGFWAGRIALPLIERARSQGHRGRRAWLHVRVWLASMNLSPDRGEGAERIRRFLPTLEKWYARYPEQEIAP